MQYCRSAGLAAAIACVLTPPADCEPPRPVEFAWFAEGEAPKSHNWSAPVLGSADYADCYGGGHLMCAMDADPPEGAYTARFTATVAEDGTYVVWVAATRPRVGSPLSVSVDDGEPVAVRAAPSVGMWGPSNVFSWMPTARVGLSAGEHTIAIGVTGRRQYDNRYYAYLDAIGLERWGDDANVAFAQYPLMPEIGDTPIRFYSGNASVGWFMQYWGTGSEGVTGAIDRPTIDLLRRCGCTAMCDYLAWCRIEEQPGEWDWSFYEENARLLHEAGIDYNIFAWLHFPPRWFMETDDYVPYECLEHGEKLQQLSLWAPFTLRLYDEFYGRLARDFGERIDFLRIAMPSEYGEVGYATGMTNWLVPQEHVHGGYWCGDRYARADFRETMRRKFGTLGELGRRWGLELADWDAVGPPEAPGELAREARELATPQARRRWLDFVDWYQDAWGEFLVRATGIVRQHFPDRELILSLGYGAEPVPWGNDQSRHIKRIAEAGAAAQTPGDIGYFATRRVSTACRVYGAPYFTEPPGNVDRHREIRRIFYDISNGTQTWFDYPGNLDGARDLLAENLEHMTGQPPVCDVAYLMPSSWWWCRPEMHFPERTVRFAEGLRDRMDYEVVDELMVREGALEKLGIRVLAIVEGDFMQAQTISALQEWVEAGGVLALMGVDHLEDMDGESAEFAALFPEGAGDGSAPAAVWQSGRAVGEGYVAFVPGADEAATKAQQEMMLELTYRLSDLDASRANAVLIDEEADGVVATLFADRALFYNGTDRLVRKQVAFRPEDFAAGAGRPTERQVELAIPAHRIAAVRFE